MMGWFYNWLDPKILRLEKWVNRRIIDQNMLDIDLDKVKPGEVRGNNMFRQPPKNGDYGPFLTNLQGGEIVEVLYGLNELEAFCRINHKGAMWWRHRDGGMTEDFKNEAFDSMEEFFTYATGEQEQYWTCVLKTKAVLSEQS